MRIRISPLVLFISSMAEQNTSNIWTQVRLLDENSHFQIAHLINKFLFNCYFFFMIRRQSDRIIARREAEAGIILDEADKALSEHKAAIRH